MNVIRTNLLVALCGILICSATPLCHADERGPLFDVKIPQTETTPAFVPQIKETPDPKEKEPQFQPDKEESEKSWGWRFLQSLALSVARINTEKQNDGRPCPRINP